MVIRKKIINVFCIVLVMLVAMSLSVPLESNAAPKVKVTKVAISNVDSEKVLEKGEKFTIKVKISPAKATNKKLKWKTSNPDVLAVSKNGVITAKKNGTATITVNSVSDPKRSAKVKIRVGAKVVAVVGDNIGKTLLMQKGEKKTFTALVSPSNAKNKKLIWSSSDSSVLTITKEGKATAKKNGTANVFVKAVDGTKKQFKCVVTVGNKITKISLTGNTIVFKGKAEKLNPTITPSNATIKTLTWTSSDPSVAKVDSTGLVTFVSDGKASITATANDGTGKAGKFTVNATSLAKDSSNFIAHRGLSSAAPENTLPAFSLATEQGFWGVECDIWESKKDEFGNSEIVVQHDRSLSRMTGKNLYINELTYEEIKEIPITGGKNVQNYTGDNSLKIPTLRQYLEIIASRPNISPVIEIKEDTVAKFSTEGVQKIVDLLDEFNLTDSAIIVCFSEKPLLDVKSIEPKIETALLLNNSSAATIYRKIIWAEANKMEGVYISTPLITGNYTSLIKALDMKLGGWTINNARTAYDLIQEFKLDFLTSDYVLY